MSMPPKTGDVYKQLVQAARDERIVTYKELGLAVGLNWRGRAHLSARLRWIFEHCRDLGLPALTAIVVSRNWPGLPGSWYWDEFGIRQEDRRRAWSTMVQVVFAFTWPDDLPEVGEQLQMDRETEVLIAKLEAYGGPPPAPPAGRRTGRR